MSEAAAIHACTQGPGLDAIGVNVSGRGCFRGLESKRPGTMSAPDTEPAGESTHLMRIRPCPYPGQVGVSGHLLGRYMQIDRPGFKSDASPAKFLICILLSAQEERP